MKTKSKTVKPSQRRSASEIATRAADKKKKMDKAESGKDESEKKVDSEMKDRIQPESPQASKAESKKPVVNEDEQKKVVNTPLSDDSEITGEEK